MQEIRFRAWEKHPITEKYSMQSWEQIKSACAEYLSDNETFSNRTIMQYTGLKDKHGVEIYESDILKIDAGDDNFKAQTHEVVFVKGAFGVRPRGWMEWTSFANMSDNCIQHYGSGEIEQYMEVIGNIHQ